MNGKEFTVSEVIDSFGINGHTWLMFVLLGLANIFDGYDFMIVNSTNTYLAPSFGLQTAAQVGSLRPVVRPADGRTGRLADHVGPARHGARRRRGRRYVRPHRP